jgi:hypothetical protein
MGPVPGALVVLVKGEPPPAFFWRPLMAMGVPVKPLIVLVEG